MALYEFHCGTEKRNDELVSYFVLACAFSEAKKPKLTTSSPESRMCVTAQNHRPPSSNQS